MAKLTIWQNGSTLEINFSSPSKLGDVLEQNNIRRSHPCGGRGVCGKCKVELLGCVSEPNAMELRAGSRLSCQSVLLGDAEVWLSEKGDMVQIELSDREGKIDVLAPMTGRLGVSVDIGTTTLAIKLFELDTGVCIGQTSMENPQQVVAADVMGRIQASLEGKGAVLQRQILQALNSLLENVCIEAERDLTTVDAMVIVGNTTMLYMLTGRNPKSLAFAPFLADDLFGRMVEILGRAAYLPHCMNAFVGADITAAVLTSEMCDKNEIALLCDIGTNGELALWNAGELYVSSTAAGPAFEGAGISCGCGSVPGAIDKVWVEDGSIRTHTIGDLPPVGICGSGLLDAIASYLELGEIDETGAMEEDELILAGDIVITPYDVRAVQLAKAAIAAGIETMLAQAGISADGIQTLYIAGGFGSHLSISSAVRIGLIPAALEDKVVVLGNAALSGAMKMLLNQNMQRKARDIAACAKHINLGGSKVFNEWFVEKILFL